jgi:hypothetical protein
MKDTCYICDEKAVLICNNCNGKVCNDHYKFHGSRCIVSTPTKLSRV